MSFAVSAPLARSTLGLQRHASSHTSRRARQLQQPVRANGLREFNEETGKVSAGGAGGGEPAAAKEEVPKFLYADENPQPPRDTMSPEMKARLRKEYYGLGGAPNQAMGNNYFLIIILVISALAVLSKLTGAI